MKRGNSVRVVKLSGAAWLLSLIILSSSFILGILLGCILAGGISEVETGALATYIEGYLSAARGGVLNHPDLLSVFWETFRWPLFVVLLSFTAAGLIGIPVLFCVRGSLLAFAVASFVRVLGGSGAILAFFLFGVTGVLAFPVLFVLGVQGMMACRVLAARLIGERKKNTVYGKECWGRCGICTAILMLCVCVEQAVIPSFLVILAGTF